MSLAEQMDVQISSFNSLRQHHEPAFKAQLAKLQAFQSERLRKNHSSMLEDKHYAAAANFILGDVYGEDITQLAHDIERVVHKALKILPDRVMTTAFTSMQIQTLTQTLDEELTQQLIEAGTINQLNDKVYAQAYHEQNRFDDRMEQFALMDALGKGLDKYVRSRIVYATYKMVKRPALNHNLDTLYYFMGRAFEVMRPVGSASKIVNQITSREREILSRIYHNDSDPFRP